MASLQPMVHMVHVDHNPEDSYVAVTLAAKPAKVWYEHVTSPTGSWHYAYMKTGDGQVVLISETGVFYPHFREPQATATEPGMIAEAQAWVEDLSFSPSAMAVAGLAIAGVALWAVSKRVKTPWDLPTDL